MGAQVLILLKKDSPFLYIVGAQAPILLKRDFPVLYRGCLGAHTFKEGLSHSVDSECAGTHILEEKKKISSFSISGTVHDSIHAQALFFYWSIGLLQ